MHKEMIRYDADRDVWCVNQETRPYALHCGECFDIAVGTAWLPCRLELDTSWYIILAETKFTLHPRTAYTVRM